MSMVAKRADLRSRRLDPVPEPWRQRIALLKDENVGLRDRGQQLEREQPRLRREQRKLRERIEGLEAERDRLGAEAERLDALGSGQGPSRVTRPRRRSPRRQPGHGQRPDPCGPSGPPG
jgi:chromosome segregation ATPase